MAEGPGWPSRPLGDFGTPQPTEEAATLIRAKPLGFPVALATVQNREAVFPGSGAFAGMNNKEAPFG